MGTTDYKPVHGLDWRRTRAHSSSVYRLSFSPSGGRCWPFGATYACAGNAPFKTSDARGAAAPAHDADPPTDGIAAPQEAGGTGSRPPPGGPEALSGFGSHAGSRRTEKRRPRIARARGAVALTRRLPAR